MSQTFHADMSIIHCGMKAEQPSIARPMTFGNMGVEGIWYLDVPCPWRYSWMVSSGPDDPIDYNFSLYP